VSERATIQDTRRGKEGERERERERERLARCKYYTLYTPVFRRSMTSATTAARTPTQPQHRYQPQSAITVTDTEPVVTVRDPRTPHNFGPVSLVRDKTVFTAERPGHYQQDFQSTSIIDDWIQHMQQQGIHHVVIIMDDNEFEVYRQHEIDLIDFYRAAGLIVHHIPFNTTTATITPPTPTSSCTATCTTTTCSTIARAAPPGGAASSPTHSPSSSSSSSYHDLMHLIHTLDAQGDKVVVHCSGGKGRCGRVACAWLCQKWCLSPRAASQEFMDAACAHGLYRLGDVQKLKQWIGYSSC